MIFCMVFTFKADTRTSVAAQYPTLGWISPSSASFPFIMIFFTNLGKLSLQRLKDVVYLPFFYQVFEILLDNRLCHGGNRAQFLRYVLGGERFWGQLMIGGDLDLLPVTWKSRAFEVNLLSFMRTFRIQAPVRLLYFCKTSSVIIYDGIEKEEDAR